MSPSLGTLRVLHVFGRMGRGGAEMWLMNVLRRIDRERFHFEFAVHRERAGEFDEEIRALGCPIHLVPSYRNPARYALDFGGLVRRGSYDVVHSHVSHFSGYPLAVARALGVPGRIAHSHTAVPVDDDSRLRTAYKWAMRRSIRMNATAGLGCSGKACAALFGADWRAWPDNKVRVLHYGYDFDRFALDERARVRAEVRAELGLAADDLVVGHIGRFVKPKNHPFMVELVAASQANSDRARQRFVLVGDGEARPTIAQQLRERGLMDAVRMTGQRSDIPRLLASFDVLILPSLWEGLPVTILEAQAAGVPCALSDRISAEAAVLDEWVLRLPIDGAASARAWLDGIADLAARQPPAPEHALARMQASSFAIEQHLDALQRIYEFEGVRAGRR